MSQKKFPEEVPEVQEFLEAQEQLEDFKKQHLDIFREYETLVDNYNTKLGAADKTVRSEDVTCGPWDRYTEVETVDWQKLFEMVGRDTFLDIGGNIKTQTVYEGNKDKLKKAIAGNQVSAEDANHIIKVSGRYHAPKKLNT